jgi:hypothetical protein
MIDPMLSECSGELAENWFIMWAVWMAASGVKTSSIRTYVTATRSRLVDWRIKEFGPFRRLPRLFKSLKWLFGEKTKVRLPVLQQHLLKIRARLDFNDWNDRLCYTAALLAWQGMLRYCDEVV